MNDNIDAKGCSQAVSEMEGSAQGADTNEVPCLASPETVARERAASDERIHLTWEDIEAHRDALSDLQWQRIKAYFHHGKRLSEIHAGDDGSRRTEKTSTEHCLGRASIRLLRSMLGMTITRPSQRAHFRKQISIQPSQESQGAMALALLNVFPDRGAHMRPGPQVNQGEEVASASGGPKTIQSAKTLACQGELPEAQELAGGDSEATAKGAVGISVGMRVECEVRSGTWEAGRVLKVEGAMATVSLDLGGQTQGLLEALRIIPMR